MTPPKPITFGTGVALGLVGSLLMGVWAAAVSYTDLKKDVGILQLGQEDARNEVIALTSAVNSLTRAFEVHVAKEHSER